MLIAPFPTGAGHNNYLQPFWQSTVFISRIIRHFSLQYVVQALQGLKLFLITVQTVLTATFNSYGNRQISPPSTKSIPLNRSTKNWHNYYVREGPPMPNLVKIHPLEASGKMGEILQKLDAGMWRYHANRMDARRSQFDLGRVDAYI